MSIAKLFLFVVYVFYTAATYSQNFSIPVVKDLIVETSYTYMKIGYSDPISFTAGKSMPAVLDGSPEAILAEFLTHLAKGEVDVAIKYWATESQKLIKKKNASYTLAEMKKSAIALNAGVTFQLVSRIVYNDYVIIETQIINSKEKATQPIDSYALKKEDGMWRLTQDLADDPVMCCRDSPESRIKRVGIPGGEFRKVLESLK